MANIPKTFADRLRGLRDQAGLSQYGLAKLSGLSKQALSRLELGDNEPTWETVQLLASALGVDCTAFADPGVKPPAPAEAKPRGRPRKDADAPAPEAAPAKKGPRKRKGG